MSLCDKNKCNSDNTKSLLNKIRKITFLPGTLLPSQKTHLIILTGYEDERAADLIEAYKASVVSLGFGDKAQSVSVNHFEINYAFYQRLVELYRNVNGFDFSLINPMITKAAIEDQIAKYPDYSVIIAPLNSKVSTVGAAYAAFANSAIQISYAQASIYNYKNYSKPGEEFFCFPCTNNFHNE